MWHSIRISQTGRIHMMEESRSRLSLPVKFPMILAQGVEGIAVGLSTKIMPHNFCELIKGSIDVLNGKNPKLLPDFASGGMGDFTQYNKGQKGGKIRLQGRNFKWWINPPYPLNLYPITLQQAASLIPSLKANDSGKIKIKKVEDNTASKVEIMVHLKQGVSPDVAIDALYAFTNCEVSISPNCCVIIDETPMFLSVDELLKMSTNNTVELLQKRAGNSAEGIRRKMAFLIIRTDIYRKPYLPGILKNVKPGEAVLTAIDKGLDPFKSQLKREVVGDDLVRLTEIKIKRISKFDSRKADELIARIEGNLDEVKNNLSHLTEYAIRYFAQILKNHGKGRERRTVVSQFDTIKARRVAAANVKLYMNREDGFIGTNLRKNEFVSNCSDIDNIIVFRRDGKFIVTPVGDKIFVGQRILYMLPYGKKMISIWCIILFIMTVIRLFLMPNGFR